MAIISNLDSPPHRNFHRPPPQVKFAADWVSRRRRFLCSVDPVPPLQHLRASNWGGPEGRRNSTSLHIAPVRERHRDPPLTFVAYHPTRPHQRFQAPVSTLSIPCSFCNSCCGT